MKLCDYQKNCLLTNSDKHSSLLRYEIINGCKKFYSTGPIRVKHLSDTPPLLGRFLALPINIMGKHSSLLRTLVNYCCKFFIVYVPDKTNICQTETEIVDLKEIWRIFEFFGEIIFFSRFTDSAKRGGGVYFNYFPDRACHKFEIIIKKQLNVF